MSNTTMNISLPEALREYVDGRVAEGSYANASDYVRALIREDRQKRAQASLEAKLLEGLASPLEEATEEYWKRLEAEARAHLKAQACRVSSRRILRRLVATLDVMDVVESIATDNLSAAARFTRAVRETEELLLAMPGIGTSRDYDNPALAGMRFHLVKGFRKYLIFCIPREHGIEVVRVLHGARQLETLFGS